MNAAANTSPESFAHFQAGILAGLHIAHRAVMEDMKARGDMKAAADVERALLNAANIIAREVAERGGRLPA